MKRCLIFAFVAMGLAACTHDDTNPVSHGGGGGGGAPSRTTENKPAECPVGIEGVYSMQGGNGSTITIRRNGVNLEVISSSGDSIIVDGRPTSGKSGSSTAICTGGKIDFMTTNTNGVVENESIETSAGGITVHTHGDQGQPEDVFAARSGDAAPVGEVGQVTQPGQSPIDQFTLPAQEPISCSSGFQYTYQYSVNDCKTGKHTLCSLIEACAALANDEYNNGCAHTDRMNQFNKMCK